LQAYLPRRFTIDVRWRASKAVSARTGCAPASSPRLGKQNMPLPETMAMTGHQSVATVVGYFRAESALGSKVSRMLDEPG
jgi:hypothetical protein